MVFFFNFDSPCKIQVETTMRCVHFLQATGEKAIREAQQNEKNAKEVNG
jgi:hypothetical protein